MNKILVLILFTLMSSASFSETAAPTCHDNSGSPYCRYTGEIDRLYINYSNVILMYFESSINTSDASSVGFAINSGEAAALRIADGNAEFARAFYSTALAAKLSGSKVSVQMRGTESGYLKIDRIWIY
jgi:hypothetical protein